MKILNEYRDFLQEITDTKIIKNRVAIIIVLLIILCCALIRIFTLVTLPLEFTDWKEIDHLNIARGYMHHGYNILKPEVPWLADPPRITAMELPLVPYITSLLFALFGYNIFTARILTILAFLVVIFFVFKLVQRELGNMTAILAALASAIMPLYHPFGFILYSEPWIIALTVYTIYQFAEWLEKEKKSSAIKAIVGFSLTIGLKVTAMYILIPIVWILYRRYHFNIKAYFKYIFLGILGLVVPVAWYSYAYYLTFHSVDVFGIFQGHNKFQTFTMLSDYNWYLTMFDRLSVWILGGKIGLILCVVGLISAFLIKKTHLFYAYLIAIAAYFVIVAEGQMDTPYRQLTIIPVFSVFVAIGAISLLTGVSLVFKRLTKSNIFSNPIFILVVSIIIVISMLKSKYNEIFEKHEARDLKRYELSQQIIKFKTPQTKIIAAGEYTIHVGGYDVSPVIYYYSETQGWTLKNGDWEMGKVDSLIKKGATLFTAVEMSREPESLGFIQQMEERFPTLYKNEKKELLLLDLKNQKK